MSSKRNRTNLRIKRNRVRKLHHRHSKVRYAFDNSPKRQEGRMLCSILNIREVLDTVVLAIPVKTVQLKTLFCPTLPKIAVSRLNEFQVNAANCEWAEMARAGIL